MKLDEFKRALLQYLQDAMPGGALNPEVTPQGTMDAAALALSPVPIVGDVMGLAADANRYRTNPEERTPGNFALTGLGALPFVPSMGAIKAYHGSPHKFDKFDISKIGTGEGAQAYGHGLYVAEQPATAKGYKKTTSYADAVRQFRKELPDDADADELLELATTGKMTEQNARIIKALANDDWLGFDYPSQAISAAFLHPNRYEMSSELKTSIDDYGHLYDVNIRWPDPAREAADPLGPQHFLDWDKPLSEQPETVRKAINAVDSNPTGRELYNDLALATSREKATDVLKQSGIPGIRYLDAGSRGAGEGTANYVVFDDMLLEILKRNGIPIK